MITLFWCPRTRASRILWLLEELGEPFEVRTIDIRDPESKKEPDFQLASPMGKVPAIMDTAPAGIVRIADSAAIGLYLADRYAQAGLAPAVNDVRRGRYLWRPCRIASARRWHTLHGRPDHVRHHVHRTGQSDHAT